MTELEIQKQMSSLETKIDNSVLTINATITDHMMKRLQNDKDLAVAMEKQNGTLDSIYTEVKRTNGRVTVQEAFSFEVKPKIDIMYKKFIDNEDKHKKSSAKWIDYAIKVGLVILGIALVKLGIINFSLPI